MVPAITCDPYGDKFGEEGKLVVFQPKASITQSMNPSKICPSLDRCKTPAIYDMSHADEVIREYDKCPTLQRRMGTGGNQVPLVGVRRLTPLECERLQGFPDNWTATDRHGKPISDSARYRVLGNAVAVPVAEWIAKRIREV